MDCIFCKIISGVVGSQKVYEDGAVLAFKDITPQAPVHLLVIPKKHIPGMDSVGAAESVEIAAVFAAIKKIAAALKLEKGYRVVANSGTDAGQAVGHLHFHLLAGRKMSWPPG